MNYDRGDVIIIPFPFVTSEGASQKARPALIISDHSIDRRFDDLIMVGITSRIVEDLKETEYKIVEGAEAFKHSGLAKTSVVRCEYIMTVPRRLVARRLGRLPEETMREIDKRLKLSLGVWG
ncbi:MAG: type II toxin-antitoxin system PemK/MazF family toxin [Methanomicrobia archaeon]|nr:type II toxin-antitoxin system PemK/MazF family toxin [Methanomicrobia archaeon]